MWFPKHEAQSLTFNRTKTIKIFKLLQRNHFQSRSIGNAKTDPVRLKWGFGEGLLKDQFGFLEAYKSPTPKRRRLLAKRPFL